MTTSSLIIAMDLIKILARQNPVSPGSSLRDIEQVSAKRIIEAARSNYVLPAFCAEMNTDASKCVHCIVENSPPQVCLNKMNQPGFEEHEIGWETRKKKGR